MDVLCQSPSALSVSETASLQCSPGCVHPPAARGQQHLRHSVLRRLHLSVVRRRLPNLMEVIKSKHKVSQHKTAKQSYHPNHQWSSKLHFYGSDDSRAVWIFLFFCPTPCSRITNFYWPDFHDMTMCPSDWNVLVYKWKVCSDGGTTEEVRAHYSHLHLHTLWMCSVGVEIFSTKVFSRLTDLQPHVYLYSPK